jgi:hypothetical protein
MRLLPVAGLLVLCSFTSAHADDLESAQKLCRAIEAGGGTNCQISEEDHTVSATIPGNRPHVKGLCFVISHETGNSGTFFTEAEWFLLLSTPEIQTVVARCGLPSE